MVGGQSSLNFGDSFTKEDFEALLKRMQDESVKLGNQMTQMIRHEEELTALSKRISFMMSQLDKFFPVLKNLEDRYYDLQRTVNKLSEEKLKDGDSNVSQ